MDLRGGGFEQNIYLRKIFSVAEVAHAFIPSNKEDVLAGGSL